MIMKRHAGGADNHRNFAHVNKKTAVMKIGRLGRTAGFWKSLTFAGNIKRMSNALMDYLKKEGVTCSADDGGVIFEYNARRYTADFNLHNGYAECVIMYECADEDYEALPDKDKAAIANHVNANKDNHCTFYGFRAFFRQLTSFYFTDRRMMTELFCKHFDEMDNTLDFSMNTVCAMIEENKKDSVRTIGFAQGAYSQPELDESEEQVAAKGILRR